MLKAETPFWRWGERIDPRVVRAMTDAADATNELSQAFAEAHLVSQRAEALVERLSREGGLVEHEPRRLAGAQTLFSAALVYADTVARIYAREALYFARLNATILFRLCEGTSELDLDTAELPVLKPSQAYSDATLIPAPPDSWVDNDPDPDADAVRPAYAVVLHTMQIMMDEHRVWPRVVLDLDYDEADVPREAREDIWGSGGVEFVEALHCYGQVCLYNVARITKPAVE